MPFLRDATAPSGWVFEPAEAVSPAALASITSADSGAITCDSCGQVFPRPTTRHWVCPKCRTVHWLSPDARDREVNPF